MSTFYCTQCGIADVACSETASGCIECGAFLCVDCVRDADESCPDCQTALQPGKRFSARHRARKDRRTLLPDPDEAPSTKPEEKHVGMDTTSQIPLAEINLDNESFMFRTKLRVKDLVDSIGKEGLQVPIIIRPLKESETLEENAFKYQLISGFRRAKAIKELGWEKVDAIIREDLNDDFDAFKVSIIENEARKTYNDLDRANAILTFRKLGKSNKEIEDFFSIGERQRQRLQELTNLPPELKNAVEEGEILSTHAVRLMQHKRKYPEAELASWVQQIKDEALSMGELNRRLKAEAQEEDGKKKVELFAVEKKRGKKRSYRIRPISINENTSEGDLKEIKKQIAKLTKFVDSLLKK